MSNVATLVTPKAGPPPVRRYYVNEFEKRVLSSTEPPPSTEYTEVEFMEGCRLVVVCNYDTTFLP